MRDRRVRRPRVVMAVVGACVIVASGCATIYDPIPMNRANIDKIPDLCMSDGPKAYATGIACAEAVRDAYTSAMVNDAVWSDRAAMVLLPLGAAAIGLGVMGTTGAPITALALGGGTGYGMATWITSKARRQVFGAGAQSLECVIKASASFNVSASKRRRIDERRADLDVALTRLAPDLNRFEGLVRNAPGKAGADALARANDVKAKALDTLRHADEVIAVLDRAGNTIIGAVQDVRAKITEAAVNTAQDLRDLQDHLKSSVYGTFQDILGITSPGGKVSGGQLQAANENLKAATDTLNTRLDEVMAAADALARELEAVNITGVNGEFQKCLDTLRGLQPPVRLRISPSSLVRITQGATKSIVATGGRAPYTVVPMWPKTVDITLTGPPESGAAKIDIAVGNNVTQDRYFLSVRDEQSDIDKTVTIEVLPKSMPASGTPAPAPAGLTDQQRLDAMTAIKTALGTKLPRAQWTNAVGNETWKSGNAGADATFSLKFESATDATNAAGDALATRLKAFPPAVTPAPTLAVSNDTLVLTVTATALPKLADAARANTWPAP